jgi:hypothetical protein
VRPTSLENFLDPNHREKSPHADHPGSSSDKLPRRIEFAADGHRQVLIEGTICVNSED